MNCKEYDRLTLMSFVSDDLDEYTKSRIVNHLRNCMECHDAVSELYREKESFLRSYPFATQEINLPDKVVLFRKRSLLVIAASLIFAVTAGYHTLVPNGDGYRIKGAGKLEMYVQDKTGVPVKRSDSIYYPKERIQFTYSTGENRYFMLLSIDTGHGMTMYYPSNADSSVKLTPGHDLPLPNSITLDSYIGPELFIAVFSVFPLHTADVRQKLKSSLEHSTGLKSLQLHLDNAEVRSVYITKMETGK